MDESTSSESHGPGGDPREFTLLRSQYVDSLLRGDEDAARSTVYRAIGLNWGAKAVYLDLLGAALVRVGEMWSRGEASVANEHQITQFTLREMTAIRQFFDPAPPRDLRALVSSVEGEQHSVGSLMVADFLRLDGWVVDYLGADVPVSALVELAATREHHLAVLSVTGQEHLSALRTTISALRETVPGASIVVGGQAVTEAATSAPDRWGADAISTDPVEAVAIALQLVGEA